ncbi:MAG: hypothetical protein P8J32_05875 [bacterium]|nr:hypothetical protein [bacterium]
MKVKEEEIDFVWVTNHWDIHLDGICKHKGKLCKFHCVEMGYWKPIEEEGVPEDDWDDDWVDSIYEITFLSFQEKVKWKWSQWKFEAFVGKHWSYRNGKRGKRFGEGRPRWWVNWAFKWYYSKKKC